ncbi:MAG: hypothetical protein OXI43_09840 [Candidatus Poribacteria bacterium]|nr:hypothetical protein [Candidatus Poribacteria bacterium]
MKKLFLFTLTLTTILGLFFSVSHLAFAQGKVNQDGGPLKDNELLLTRPDADHLNEDHGADAPWITKWYGPDGNYTNNGGFNTSGPKDLMSEGTNGEITDVSLSTMVGLNRTKRFDVEWEAGNGGTRGWTVFQIDPGDGNNMNRGGPADNTDIYAVLVIDAPKAMTSVMSPTHDDYAQIWINGEKWYNNSRWTGAVYNVDYNIEVKFRKGTNVLLYRCGEGGGSAYFNLHFDDETHNAVKIYPDKATNQDTFFAEIDGILPVEPVEKITTTWADIKRNR